MSTKNAIRIMLALVSVLMLFHLGIILKIIPYEITWGGRLKNDAEMYVFETISIGINLLFGWVLLMKGAYLKPLIPLKIINGILWAFLILFVLNTLGNLVAKTAFEKSFTLLTLLYVILIWKVLRAKE